MGTERNLAGVTTGETFMHKFGSTTVVTEQFYFYPDLTNTGEYRFALDAASVTKINKWLGLQIVDQRSVCEQSADCGNEIERRDFLDGD